MIDPPHTVFARGDVAGLDVIVATTADEYAMLIDAASPVPLIDDASYRTTLTSWFGAAGAQAVEAQYPSAAFSSPRAAAIAVATDVIFTCPSRRSLAALATGGARVRHLVTTRAHRGPDDADWGAAHGFDVMTLFGTGLVDATTDHLHSSMVELWRLFAGGRLPASSWPPWDEVAQPYLEAGDRGLSLGAAWAADRCEFWAQLGI